MISPRPKAQLIRENVRSFVHSNSRPPLPYFLFLFRFVVDTDFGFGAGIGPLCVIRDSFTMQGIRCTNAVCPHLRPLSMFMTILHCKSSSRWSVLYPEFPRLLRQVRFSRNSTVQYNMLHEIILVTTENILFSPFIKSDAIVFGYLDHICTSWSLRRDDWPICCAIYKLAIASYFINSFLSLWLMKPQTIYFRRNQSKLLNFDSYINSLSYP